MRNSICLSGMGILFAALFSRCANTANSAGADGYATIPLKEFKYKPLDLPSGTEIRILAFSGDKRNEKGTLYYSQFICVNKTSGDTLRVLAAFISVNPDGTPANTMFTTPTLFDGNKGILDASFLIPNSDQQIVLDMDLPDGGNPKDIAKKAMASTSDTAAKKEYVILQKGVPMFAGNYGTAIGILSFREQPW